MHKGQRDEPLLQPEANVVSLLPSGPRIMVNFLLMTTCFSINHGTVTALIALASSTEGKVIGNYSTGGLYLMYTVVALFFSNVIVDTTGFKWGLASGLWVYCAYVVSTMIYKFTESVPALLIGSAIGGIAAGFLWTAQGGYFNLTCTLYAKATNQPREKVTGTLGGIFAALYLGGEVTLKLLSAVLTKVELGGFKGETFVLVSFSIAAVASAIGMTLVQDLKKFDPSPAPAGPPKSIEQRILAKSSAALALILSDPKMALLIPAQMAFGFMSGFLNATSNSNIVKPGLGANNVGYVSAITASTATLLTIPMATLSRHVSKVYLMMLGGVLFSVEAALFLTFDNETLGTWGWCAVLYSLHGAGRCVWESTNKAVMADFFEANAPAAFANVIWSSGGASTLGFFLFPHISKQQQLIICLVVAGLQIVCSLVAFQINTKEKAMRALGADSRSKV